MASRHRAQLPVLACVAAALACAHVASCFSRGDLVLCTWGGDSFSTGSLQLVSVNARGVRTGAINVGKAILASKLDHLLAIQSYGLSSLTVSPDRKYAFAMVFGGDGAYYEHPYVVVVDIHKAKRVVLVAKLPLPKGYQMAGFSLSGGVGPKLVANTYDPAMAVGPASGAGSYRLYALLQPTYFSGYQPGYATVGTFLYNVGRRTFSCQTRYSTSAASRTDAQQLIYAAGNVYTYNLENVTDDNPFGSAGALWTLSKPPRRRLVKLATGPVLDGIAVINSRSYYGTSFSDLAKVSLKPTANGLRSTQDSHDIDISVGGDPFHTPGDDTEEVNFSIATSPLSPVLYLTFEEDELTPHLAVVTRILVISKSTFKVLHRVDLPLYQTATGWPAVIP